MNCLSTVLKFWSLTDKVLIGQAMIASAKEIRAERNLTMASLWMIGKKLFSFKSWESKEVLNYLLICIVNI